MKVKTYIVDHVLYARLHLEEADKIVLRENKHLTHRRVIDIRKSGVVTLADLLGYDRFRLDLETASEAHTCKEHLEKSIDQIDKIVAALVPAPEEPEPTLPFIEERDWYAHALLIARTRWGKTNILRWRIERLLPQIKEGKASLIVMEPKGPFTEQLLRHTGLPKDRVIEIDPENPWIHINPFDIGDGSSRAFNDAIGRVERLLRTISFDLTTLQRDALHFALQALFVLEQPSLTKLKLILRNGLEGIPAYKLSPSVREYFEKDFKRPTAKGNSITSTSAQIISRLNAITAAPHFDALLNSTETNFDLGAELQKGRIIVIKANNNFLQEGTALYGRFWIEQIYKAVFDRYRIPEHERIPTTVILDEAQVFIGRDHHVARILDQAAEAKVGMIFAIHHFGQEFDANVKGSLLTNTTLKFASNTTEEIHDLRRALAGCEAEFITSLPKYVFAYYGPGLEQAIRVKFPLVEFPQGERFKVRQPKPKAEPKTEEVKNDGRRHRTWGEE